MTKERIVKELSKVREQLAGLQARERDLAEQLQMAEDAEKMKFIEKNKISLDRLILLNKVSEEEIMRLYTTPKIWNRIFIIWIIR